MLWPKRAEFLIPEKLHPLAELVGLEIIYSFISECAVAETFISKHFNLDVHSSLGDICAMHILCEKDSLTCAKLTLMP